MARSNVVTNYAFSTAGALASPDWQQLRTYDGTVTAAGGVVYTSGYAVPGVNSGGARWIGSGTFTENQFSSIVISNLQFEADQVNIAVLVRASGGDDDAAGETTRSFYAAFVQYNNPSTYTTVLGRVVSGAWTQLHSAAQAWSNGDRLELEVEGTTLRLCRNGTPLGGSFTQTDSSLSSGAPGIGGSGGNIARGDDWTAGNLVSVNFASLAVASNPQLL